MQRTENQFILEPTSAHSKSLKESSINQREHL